MTRLLSTGLIRPSRPTAPRLRLSSYFKTKTRQKKTSKYRRGRKAPSRFRVPPSPVIQLCSASSAAIQTSPTRCKNKTKRKYISQRTRPKTKASSLSRDDAVTVGGAGSSGQGSHIGFVHARERASSRGELGAVAVIPAFLVTSVRAISNCSFVSENSLGDSLTKRVVGEANRRSRR